MNYITSSLPKFNKALLAFFEPVDAIIVAYLLAWVAESFFSIPLVAPFGFLLLGLLPGYYLIKLFRFDVHTWSPFGRLGIYSLVSLTAIGLLLFFTASRVDFTVDAQRWLWVGSTFILMVLSKIKRNSTTGFLNRLTQHWTEVRQLNWRDKVVFLIPMGVFLVAVWINPYVDDSDNYLLTLNKSIREATVMVTYPRVLFTPFLATYHFVTGISTIFIFKWLFIGLFCASLGFIYEAIVQKINYRPLAWLTYVGILIPPVIITELMISRPQVAILLLTFPILLCLGWSLDVPNRKWLGLAFIFSFVASGFHQLGMLLVILSLLVLVYSLGKDVVTKKIVVRWQHVVLAIIVVAPYVKLLKLTTLFVPIYALSKYFLSFMHHLSWRWWFLDSYATLDGYQVGWPGVQALFYYLYNGVALFLLIGLIILLARQKIVAVRAGLTLALLYVSFYFVVAEILPRLGLYFLPNRAWPHLMIAAFLVFFYLVAAYQEKIVAQGRWFVFVSCLLILSGFSGSMYVLQNWVGTVFREEIPAAQFIKTQIPNDALIVSTQPNRDLVSLYGDHPFISMPRLAEGVSYSDRTSFMNYMDEALEKITQDNTGVVVPERSIVTQHYTGDTLIVSEKSIISPQHVVRAPIEFNSNEAIYFIYSFRKLAGMNGARPYNQRILDSANQNYFRSLKEGVDVVYRDDSVVIVKVRDRLN